MVVRGERDHAATGVVAACVRDRRDHAWVRHAAREAELRRAALRLVTAWSPLADAGAP